MATDELDSLIRIQHLEVQAHIGVPEDERASPQRLTLNLTLWPLRWRRIYWRRSRFDE